VEKQPRRHKMLLTDPIPTEYLCRYRLIHSAGTIWLWLIDYITAIRNRWVDNI